MDATGVWGAEAERPFGRLDAVLPARGSHLVVERRNGSPHATA